MQHYVCEFSKEDSTMSSEGWGSISSSQTDGEFSEETSTLSNFGMDYRHSILHDLKGDILTCAF